MELWEIALQEKGLYHIGRSKRDGAPHGSGRYPLGSGDRPYQYKEIAKGQTFSRLSTRTVENVRGVRKYVTIGDKPNENVKNLFTKYYDNVFEHTYEAVKDIKVASIQTNVDEFRKMMSDPKFKKQALASIEDHRAATGTRKKGDIETDFFESMGMMNAGTEAFMNRMKKLGYDAIEDKFGMETGQKDSLVILDPDRTLRLKKVNTIKMSYPWL